MSARQIGQVYARSLQAAETKGMRAAAARHRREECPFKRYEHRASWFAGFDAVVDRAGE